MRKDLKTGMLLGVVLAIIAVVVISIYSATVESRLQYKGSGSTRKSNKRNDPKTDTGTQAPPLPVTSQTDSQNPLPTEQADIIIHTVADGETLSAISTLYYGTIDQQQKILDANTDTITNPNRLRTGMRLKIP